MKNKHPHHDLIVEWVKDTNKAVQMSIGTGAPPHFGTLWSARCIGEVLDDVTGSHKFRIKPREFEKGHWYLCMFADGESYVLTWSGAKFSHAHGGVAGFTPESMLKIGKSLGVINFE